MRAKQFILSAVLVLCMSAAAFASRKNEVTLLIVPRDEQAVRIGRDIAGKFPTLLLSYRIAPGGNYSLHGWNGREWLNVTPEDYREGLFFRAGPETALIVEKAGAPVPPGLVPPASWCSTVYKVGTTEVRPLLHLVGRHFDFSHKEWKWFADSYKFSVEDINPEGLNIAWYHRRLSDQFKSRGNVGSGDLRFLTALRIPAPPAETEEVSEPEQEVEIPAVNQEVPAKEQQPEMELPEDPGVNPLEEAAPEAVVLGAGPANEAAVAEEQNATEGM